MRVSKAEAWYGHKPENVLLSKNCKIMRDFLIQTDKDTRAEKTKMKKRIKMKNWSMKWLDYWSQKKYVIPVVIGASGTVTRNLGKWIEKKEIDVTTETLYFEHKESSETF